MPKNIVFSVREHEIMKSVINKLKTVSDVNLYCHDPTKNFFNLSRMPKAIKEADLIIVKVRISSFESGIEIDPDIIKQWVRARKFLLIPVEYVFLEGYKTWW